MQLRNVVLGSLLLATTAHAERLVRHHPDHAVAGQYIVVLKDDAAAAVDLDRAIDRLAGGAAISHRYRSALRGFAARMSEQQAERLAQDPEVAWVEQDTRIYADGSIQTNAIWNLDRIDQPALPL